MLFNVQQPLVLLTLFTRCSEFTRRQGQPATKAPPGRLPFWARLPVSISAWYCSPRLKIVRVSGGAVGGAAPLPFLPICASRVWTGGSGLLPVRRAKCTYSYDEFPVILLLTLRKFSFCSHSVVPTFCCCSVVTVQHFNTVFLLTLENSNIRS